MNALSRRMVLSLLASTAGCQSTMANSFFCAESLPRDTRVYPARIRRFERLVDEGKISEQETEETCWAAAVHAVLIFHRVRVSQEEVFEHVKGKVGPGSGTGTLKEIIRGLSPGSSGWFVNTGDSRTLVQDLLAGNPVIVGVRPRGETMGHVIVVYGCTYTMNQYNGQTFVDMVDIWDPAVGKGLDEISGCDLDGEMKFMLHSWRP